MPLESITQIIYFLESALIPTSTEIFITVGVLPTTTSSLTPGTGCKVHIIKEGDICWDISENNNLSLETFLSYNPNINCDFLDIGQKVCLSPGVSESIDISSSNPTFEFWKPSTPHLKNLLSVKLLVSVYLLFLAILF
ncbi:hypothetical protein HK099_007126 [Clydaea vesicula]|uniref:LysM domain-containing protein n=1 Tax=Clydaea vesicula TaxID=447962 RepID=A0AAD5U0D4_9FUNG|nr:hypothetical protein HK099_007126 [Clydaea vesicula]